MKVRDINMRRLESHRGDTWSYVLLGLTICFLVVGGFVALLCMQGNGESRRHAIEADPTGTPTPTPTADGIEIVFIDGIPTAVYAEPTSTPTDAPVRLTPASTATPTPAPTATNTPTSAPTPTHTPVPTCTTKPVKAVSTPKPTNTPKPTKTPEKREFVAYPTGYPHSEKVDSTKTRKPYTRFTVYTAKSTAQYKLQQVARTNGDGLRVVTDPNGVERYCVALGAQWAGGQVCDIGRCFDVKMANGATIHCALADVKKVEHSQGGEGRYGKNNNDFMEFVVDQNKLNDKARKTGDISNACAELQGGAVEIIVLDLYIKNFGK